AVAALRFWSARCVCARAAAARGAARAALGAARPGGASGAQPVAVSTALAARWMQAALDEAALAPAHGDVPVGAVIVGADDRELARAHTRRELDADPTAHAELLALRAAALGRGHWRLNDCTL